MDLPFAHTIRTRFRDLDAMGHVNHAVYLTYLEEARVAFFEQAFGRLDRERPFDFVVVRIEVDYRRSARLGEVLTTRLGVVRWGRTSFDFAYRMDDAEGRRVAEGRSVQACVDREGRPVPVPEDFRRAVEKLHASAPPVGDKTP